MVFSHVTHKKALSNERIKAVSPTEVTFTARANHQGGKRRITLPTPEFIHRFLLHVLPGGIKRIRHYGVLANGCKKTQLAQARQALQQPAPNPQATESARDFMARVARIKVNACSCCQASLKMVQSLAG